MAKDERERSPGIRECRATWCRQYAIGRLRVGALMVSRPALAMLLDDDLVALCPQPRA